MRAVRTIIYACAFATFGCDGLSGMDVALSKRAGTPRELGLGRRVPDVAETTAIGPLEAPIGRRTPAFGKLVKYEARDVLFKDEEGTSADRMMTPGLRDHLTRLAALVAREWPELTVRVTEAWDDGREHGETSVHYEGRAADITTSDVDAKKLGRLARLSVDAGFGWVYYENPSHVHVSVGRE